MIEVKEVSWPVNEKVKGLTTLRKGGVSAKPYDELNLAAHVGDLPAAVQNNRGVLRKELNLPAEPNWLSQTHSDGVVRVGAFGLKDEAEADAAFTDEPNQVLAVMTADCLPLLLATKDGSELAIAHCGWKGIAAGIIERTLDQFEVSMDEVCAWMGPAIGPEHFEVGQDVLDAILALDKEHESAFKPHNGRWLADIYQITRQQLVKAGVGFIGGGSECTFSQSEDFYSYRRDGKTGRMASLLWREI